MVFNLSAAIGLVGNVSVAVTRFAPDTFDTYGVAAARTVASAFTIAKCSAQPVTGAELKRAGLAVEQTERISVWSPVALQLRDRLSIAGRGLFEVEHLDPWADTGGYAKAIARKLAPQEPA